MQHILVCPMMNTACSTQYMTTANGIVIGCARHWEGTSSGGRKIMMTTTNLVMPPSNHSTSCVTLEQSDLKPCCSQLIIVFFILCPLLTFPEMAHRDNVVQYATILRGRKRTWWRIACKIKYEIAREVDYSVNIVGVIRIMYNTHS